MDIFSLIKTDHKNVKTLLKKLNATKESSGDTRDRLFKKIKTELVAHNKAEEKVFYSKLKATRSERVLIHEGKDEHGIGGQVLHRLEAMKSNTEAFSALAKVLKDLVEHHIEEEEGEVHPVARKEFSKEEARDLGTEFKTLKNEIKSELTH